jgi:hypothetical protein
MNYFLLLHKNKNYVSDNKNLLLQKADEIVSEYILEQMTQTGASYRYEKVVEEDEQDELKFIVISRNCNALSFNQVDEVICKIVSVYFIEDSNINREEQTTETQDENDKKCENDDNNTEYTSDEKHDDNNDIIEEDSFEKIENTENTYILNSMETTTEKNESFHSKEE